MDPLGGALWEPGLLGILPLALLAADGMRRDVCEAICERVKHNSDVLGLTLTLASMVFTSQEDQRRLRRKVGMFEDIIRDTWFYQHILEQGLEQGLELGLEAARMGLLGLIQTRFPDMRELALQRINATHDAEVLSQLIIKIGMASTAEEVLRSLLEIPASDLRAGQPKQGPADFHAGNNAV
jgi:predicted transposase YdaD